VLVGANLLPQRPVDVNPLRPRHLPAAAAANPEAVVPSKVADEARLLQ
jgi:hypothetical protein